MPQTGRSDPDVERALRASEEMHRGLVENASDLIYAIDLEGNFTFINRAARRITDIHRRKR